MSLRSPLLLGCILVVMFFIVLTGLSSLTARTSLHQQLDDQVGQLLSDALLNTGKESETLTRIERQLLQQWQALRFDSHIGLPMIQTIKVNKLSLTPSPEPVDSRKVLSWPYGEQYLTATPNLSIQFHWFNLSLASLLGTLLIGLAYQLLPNPQNQARFYWRQKLLQLGLQPKAAAQMAQTVSRDTNHQQLFERLSQTTELLPLQLHQLSACSQVQALTPEQLNWLIAALNQGHDPKESLKIATHPNELQFDLPAQQVLIHGMAIRLAKTPLLYYYWYAQRKTLGQPPYVNPNQSKPDLKQGAQLAQLMVTYSGHQKAIRDLQSAGLKNKTLDQNRNKIKEELVKALGELANDYLFEARRDPKTARYAYQLRVSEARIKID